MRPGAACSRWTVTLSGWGATPTSAPRTTPSSWCRKHGHTGHTMRRGPSTIVISPTITLKINTKFKGKIRPDRLLAPVHGHLTPTHPLKKGLDKKIYA